LSEPSDTSESRPLESYGGTAGALLPLGVFLAGVATLGLAGAPDERGFWPILLAGLAVGLLLARNRTAYAEAVLGGMSRPIVMLMVLAWLLAGVLGSLINASGFVGALVDVAARLGVSGGGFVLTSFLIAAAVSTSTGTSLGTLIICVPLLYPAAGALGAEPVWLIGAILGGATFGDNISPVSDTTVASATTQEADIGGVVRSRLKYALPAAVVAAILYTALGGAEGAINGADAGSVAGGGAAAGGVGAGGGGAAGAAAGLVQLGSLLPLVMLLPPALTVVMLLRRAHLLPSLMVGVVSAAALGVAANLFTLGDLLRIDSEAFIARGIVLDGMERGVGISVFTLLLMGLVGGVEAAGLMDRLLERAERAARTSRRAEWSIFGAVSAAVLLTTHSVVAILAVGRLARDVGPGLGISRYRRANILDVTVCTYPFLLPFFIPTILAGSLTTSGAEFGVGRVTALEAGLANLHSWGLLIVLLAALLTGRGRGEGAREHSTATPSDRTFP